MSLFSKQKVFCNACGKEFETAFTEFDGQVCSRACDEELNWRRTLSAMGSVYYPKPVPKEPAL